MRVISIKENKNGSATIVYELNDSDQSILKSVAKKRHKKYDNKFINSCILTGIKNYIKENE